MVESLIPHIESGALVVTANARLSRTLRLAYDERRRASGASAWSRARTVPWSGWIRSLWDDAALGGDATATVLSEAQELHIWRSIIESSEAGHSLLSIRDAAREAASAWSIAAQYRVPVTARLFRSTPDASAFLDWAQAFEAHCRENGWISPARVPDALAAFVQTGVVQPPQRMVLCGFDDLTPQQNALLDACAAVGTECVRFAEDAIESSVQTAPFADTTAELRAAAQWARAQVERQPDARIAVVIPDLAKVREQARSIFAQELESGVAPWAARPRPSFHISSGAPLSAQPVVAAAMLALQLSRDRIPVDTASAILRCPYLRGAEERASARANADARLRSDNRRRTIPVAALDALMPDVSEPFRQAWRGIAPEQTFSGWRAAFDLLLAAAGWPGDATLSSAEYQAAEAFRAALDEFAAADLNGEKVASDTARERLRELLDETEFSIEDLGAPVQVMGVLESAGSQFDALWVAGLHDGAWPRPPGPHPFIPLAVQLELDLPHSSADRERRFAQTATDRLLSSAPEIVMSWPTREGDAALRRSSLIPDARRYSPEPVPGWTGYVAARTALESVPDHVAPPVEAIRTTGGTGLLKHQAACPFRCFATVRLGTKELEAPDAGLTPMERGNFIHDALDLFWEKVQTHERLCATDPAAVAALARQCVDAAFADSPERSRLMDMEADRATALVTEWVEMERGREPFRVVAREDERTTELAGLPIRGRLDRIDELAGGAQVIVDYKCKAHPARPEVWDGERPDEPQVPFYCATHGRPVAGALFGNINREGPGFTGWTVRDGVAPGAKADPDLAARVAEWKATLEKLARDFAEGKAEVDPKPGACDYCGMQALCRIQTEGV